MFSRNERNITAITRQCLESMQLILYLDSNRQRHHCKLASSYWIDAYRIMFCSVDTDNDNKVGFTKADGRELSPVDQYLFQRPGSILTLMVGVAMMTDYDDARLRAAFHRTVQTSTLLQTVVDKENMVFQRQDDWPEVTILCSSNGESDAFSSSDQEAMEAIKSFIAKHQTRIQEGDQSERCRPIDFAVARGYKKSFLGLVTPHHFLDGVAVGTVMIKFLFYAKLPVWMWPVIDCLSRDHIAVPTFMEMTLKNQLSCIGKVDGSLCKANDPNNIKFPDFQSDSMFAYSEILGVHVDDQIMSNCRRVLRRNGLTITSIFDALAVKVLASLLDWSNNHDNQSPILVLSGVDGRNVGKWGDYRDLLKGFPLIANYAFAVCTQIPFESAVNDSLESIARVIKANTSRALTDVTFRLHQIQGGPHLGVWCGSSCPQTPLSVITMMKLVGIPPMELVPTPRKPAMPFVWFTCGTIHPSTTVLVDLKLPIPGLTKTVVREKIAECVKGSAIEPLFFSFGK